MINVNTSKIKYPSNEIQLLNSLNSLFKSWLSYSKGIDFPYGLNSSDIVLDGFYPHYTHQQCKILFIGRESLGLSGENYIDLMHYLYTSKQHIGGISLNQHRFHSLMLRIAYGLNCNYCDWDKIPPATEIADSFATEDGVSFAFMNLSKLSNESDDWQVDWKLVDGFVDAFKNSKVNFFSEQIDVICPDVIVTMNLESRLQALGKLTALEYGENASYYTLKTKSNTYLVIDSYHFSAIKDQENCFYNPIIDGLSKFNFK